MTGGGVDGADVITEGAVRSVDFKKDDRGGRVSPKEEEQERDTSHIRRWKTAGKMTWHNLRLVVVFPRSGLDDRQNPRDYECRRTRLYSHKRP